MFLRSRSSVRWLRRSGRSERGALVHHGVAACQSPPPHRRGELLRLLPISAGHLLRGQNHPPLRHRGLLGAPLLPAVRSRLRGALLLLQRMWRPPAQLLHGRIRGAVELRDGRGHRHAGAPGPQSAARVRTGPGLLPPPGGGLRWHRGPVGLLLKDVTQVGSGSRVTFSRAESYMRLGAAVRCFKL